MLFTKLWRTSPFIKQKATTRALLAMPTDQLNPVAWQHSSITESGGMFGPKPSVLLLAEVLQNTQAENLLLL